MRNEELFPFIKSKSIIEEATGKIILTAYNATQLTNIMKKIVHSLAAALTGTSNSINLKFKKWVSKAELHNYSSTMR